jgi:hypothetical protein
MRMDNVDSQCSRPEVIVAALLYLMTAYRRTRCPCLASCIARHFEHLAQHEKTDRVIRQIAAATKDEWEAAALSTVQPPAQKRRRWFGFPPLTPVQMDDSPCAPPLAFRERGGG